MGAGLGQETSHGQFEREEVELVGVKMVSDSTSK